MINSTKEITEFDREIRPSNLSKMLSDKEWFAMCNELGEVNERKNESWSLSEVFNIVKQVSICGTWEYATIHDFSRALNHLDKLEG